MGLVIGMIGFLEKTKKQKTERVKKELTRKTSWKDGRLTMTMMIFTVIVKSFIANNIIDK
jgi:hypothetical protein